MRTQHHSCTPTSQKFYSGHRGVDTAIIGDSRSAGFERHIQIGPQQHALAADLDVLDQWQSGRQGDFLQITTVATEDLIQLPDIANVTSQFHQFRDILIFESCTGEGLLGFPQDD